MAANQIPFIIGTGENKGLAFIFDKSTKLYNEILLNDSEGDSLSGKATGRALKLEEILTKQKEEVKGVDPKLPEEATKRLVGIVSSFNAAIDNLPTQERLNELTVSAKSQMVIGTTIIPTLMDTIRNISNSLNVSEIEKIQEGLGMKYVESKKSKEATIRWNNAKSLMDEQVAEIQRKIDELNSKDPDYTIKVDDLNNQKIELEREFYTNNPAQPEPVSETQYVAAERLGTLMDAMSAIVTSVNKVDSIKVPKGPMKMAIIERRVTKAYDSMLKLVGNLSTSLSKTDIDEAMGWKDSGMDEYVMVEKPTPDGKTYRDFYTVKKYDSLTDKEQDVKVKNVDYVKPHFEAEEALLRVGEFVTKVTDPVKKISSMDLSKTKGPHKIKKDMGRLAKSMGSMVNELVKSFSKIDISGSKEPLELLIGNQGEEKVIETMNTLNDPNNNYTEYNQSTEKIITGKRASIIDVMSAFLDTCGKITSFDAKPFIKKSLKFKASAPIVRRAFNGVLTSMVEMVPSQQSFNYGDATNSIQALAKYTTKFNDDAFNAVLSVKVPTEKLVAKRREMRKANKQTAAIVAGMTDILNTISGTKKEKVGFIDKIRGASNKKTEEGSPEETAEALATINTPVMPDVNRAASNIKERVKLVTGVLSDISSLKTAAKETKSTKLAMVSAKNSIRSAIGLFDYVKEKASENDLEGKEQVLSFSTDLSSAMASIEPGIVSVNSVSQQARKTREKDIAKTRMAVETLVDTMEYVSQKDVDYTKLSETSVGLSDTMDAIVQLNLASLLMPEDNEWMDLLFDKKDGAMTKFIAALVNVYYTFRKKKFTPEKADELNASVTGLDSSIDGMSKLLVDAQDLSHVAESTNVDGLSNGVLGENGPIMAIVTCISELLKRMEKEKLDEEGIETAKKSIDSLRSAAKALIGIMLSARLLSAIVSRAKVDDSTEEKSKKLIDVLMTPIKELGDEETYEQIKRSLKSVLILSLELLILTAVITIVGVVFVTHAKGIIAGMALIGLMVWASLKIMDALIKRKQDGSIQDGAIALLMIAGSFLMFAMSILLLGLVQDLSLMSMLAFGLMVLFAIGILWLVNKVVNRGGITKGGIPAICLPLLAIAGSFIMFALSILILGLVDDIAIESLLSFALLVGIAIGVLWLISKMDKASIKGALVLMIVGGAFIIFSFVLLILAHIAEYCDFLQMLGLVGIIAALIGVAALAGFAIVPLLLGSVGLIVLGVALAVFSVGLTILFGVGKLLGDDIEETIAPIVDTITYIVKRLRALAVADILVATVNALFALAMVAALTATTVLILALKAIAPKPEDVEGVKLAMVGIAGALHAITSAMCEIGIIDIGHAMLVSIMALVMLVPLSIMALILLGFSRMRIASEFDENNKPKAWESLTGSSFDRVGETMVGLVNALKAVTDAMDQIGIISIVKGLFVAATALGMMIPLSIIALILLGFSRMRIATEFDENNKPIKWESLDGSSFDRVGDVMVNMVGALNRTTEAINEIGLVAMTKAMVKAVEALAMVGAIAGIMAILSKIGTKRVPIEWNDKNEPTKWEDFDDTKITESVRIAGVLVKSIDEMAMMIAEYDTKKLKTAKKNAKLMKGIISPISKLLDLVIRLTEGPISYGEVDENGNPLGNGKELKGSLGDYLKSHEKQVTDNIKTLVGIFNDIAATVASESGIGNVNTKTLKRAKKNMGLVSKIIDALNPGIELIKELTSDYNIGTEENPQIVDFGDFLAQSKQKIVDEHLPALFGLISDIADKAQKLNEGGPSNRDLRKARRKMGLVAKVIDALQPAMDLIMSLTDGQYNIGTEENPIMVNLGDYLAHNADAVFKNVSALIELIKNVGDYATKQLTGDNSPGVWELYKAKLKIGVIGKIFEAINPAMDLIMKLSDGKYDITDDEGKILQSVNLGKYLSHNADQVQKSVGKVIDLMKWVQEKVNNELLKDANTSAFKAYKDKMKLGAVGQIVEAMSSVLNLVEKLGTGNIEIRDDKGKVIRSANISDFINENKDSITENIEELLGFTVMVGQICKVLTEPQKAQPKKMKTKIGQFFANAYAAVENFVTDAVDFLFTDKRATNAAARAAVISGFTGVIGDMLGIVERLASGQIPQYNDQGKQIGSKSISKVLSESSGPIKDNIKLLINFIKNDLATQVKALGDLDIPENGVESVGNTIISFSEMMEKILDNMSSLSAKMTSKKVQGLIDADKTNRFKSTMERVFDAYSYPFDDKLIYAKQSQFNTRLKNMSTYNDLMKKIMDVKNVSDYEDSVKATGDMVNSINSINDSKIDKLNTLMRNMIKFGETMDEALKDVFDQIVELAEELHYIIEANDRKQNPQNYRNQPQQLPGQQRNNQQQTAQGQQPQQRLDTSRIEGRIDDLINAVNQIRQNLPANL